MEESSKMMNVSVEELINLYMAGFGNGMSTAVDAIQKVDNDTHKSIHKLVGKTIIALAIEGLAGVALMKYLKEKAEEKKEDTYTYGEES